MQKIVWIRFTIPESFIDSIHCDSGDCLNSLSEWRTNDSFNFLNLLRTIASILCSSTATINALIRCHDLYSIHGGDSAMNEYLEDENRFYDRDGFCWLNTQGWFARAILFKKQQSSGFSIIEEINDCIDLTWLMIHLEALSSKVSVERSTKV